MINLLISQLQEEITSSTAAMDLTEPKPKAVGSTRFWLPSIRTQARAIQTLILCLILDLESQQLK